MPTNTIIVSSLDDGTVLAEEGVLTAVRILARHPTNFAFPLGALRLGDLKRIGFPPEAFLEVTAVESDRSPQILFDGRLAFKRLFLVHAPVGARYEADIEELGDPANAR
jgi:hypothetical protein